MRIKGNPMQLNLRPAWVAAIAALAALPCASVAAPSAPGLTPQAAINDYCAAWSVADRSARERMLARVWAPDAVYSDPGPTYSTGVAGLSGVIADFQRQFPGTHFLCSDPQAHHRFMRVTWILVRSDGAQVTHGEDIYDMAPDGRIQRIVGFFGDAPAIKP